MNSQSSTTQNFSARIHKVHIIPLQLFALSSPPPSRFSHRSLQATQGSHCRFSRVQGLPPSRWKNAVSPTLPLHVFGQSTAHQSRVNGRVGAWRMFHLDLSGIEHVFIHFSRIKLRRLHPLQQDQSPLSSSTLAASIARVERASAFAAMSAII